MRYWKFGTRRDPNKGPKHTRRYTYTTVSRPRPPHTLGTTCTASQSAESGRVPFARPARVSSPAVRHPPFRGDITLWVTLPLAHACAPLQSAPPFRAKLPATETRTETLCPTLHTLPTRASQHTDHVWRARYPVSVARDPACVRVS